jgi:hypothetical protein
MGAEVNRRGCPGTISDRHESGDLQGAEVADFISPAAVAPAVNGNY